MDRNVQDRYEAVSLTIGYYALTIDTIQIGIFQGSLGLAKHMVNIRSSRIHTVPKRHLNHIPLQHVFL